VEAGSRAPVSCPDSFFQGMAAPCRGVGVGWKGGRFVPAGMGCWDTAATKASMYYFRPGWRLGLLICTVALLHTLVVCWVQELVWTVLHSLSSL